jgi:WXXGXW repeat (2 copies)
MKLSRTSLSLLLVGCFIATSAVAQINVSINLAPPAPQYEVVPALQPGYVWAPGYWGWSGDHHVWVRGRPIAQREGYRWAPDRWDQRDQGYYRTAGHWERDEKHDNGKHKGWDKGKDKDKGEHGKG